VALEDLRACNRSLMDDPEDFALHPKIEKARKRRRAVLDDEDEPSVDWATAEDLALATILAGGTPVRLTGQDTARGTFSQRHAVLHDVEDGKEHVPLQALEQAEAAFEVRNSPLCENAALGFEYGYQLRARDALVIWEAQYGDFVNNAQSMIDEFLLSGEAKWKLASGLVLLLPHGHEGQGPDHSSARPERFLSLAADGNFRLVNCTTAAQYFHVLREQAARLDVPLVVLTPKSLLRHERVASAPRELAEGRFRPVIGGAESGRVVLCSGKLAIDLLKSGHDGAVVRLEQLYPFPRDDVEEALDGHDGEIVWAQEEPRNMGAWPFLEPRLRELAGDRGLAYVGRDRSSSPAEGASAWHRANQEALVDLAFGEGEPPAGGMIERS